MLKKITTVDHIAELQNGCIQVRAKVITLKDDVQIDEQIHRHVVAPGDDYSNEDIEVQTICAIAHTSEVIEAYRLAQQERIPA
jgi:hypothetical protein